MKLELHAPFAISPSLEPALHIGDAWLELRDPHDGGERSEAGEFHILFADGSEYAIKGFRPGAGGMDSWFSAILSFLSAWKDSFDYGERSENYTLFPVDNTNLRDWVEANHDEIAMLSMEIDEAEDLIKIV